MNSLTQDLMKNEITEAVFRVIGKGTFILGEEVKVFELDFAKYLGVSHCITCANGTDALEMALEVLGIGDGDEVILPAFGWVSPAMAVQRSGATPVFVDVEYETGNIDVELIQAAITEKTKAIIPIHLYGNPCRIKELRAICDKEKLYLIEDCAQAHGAAVDGRKVGGFGDLAVFSFYPTKNLGAFGDAGAIVTSDDSIATRLKALRDYGRASRHVFEFAGRNSRMDEIQAAILNVKLKYLDSINQERRRQAKVLWKELGLPDDSFPKNSVFHQFVIKTIERDRLMNIGRSQGVSLDIHYPFTIPETLGVLDNYLKAQFLKKTCISLPFVSKKTFSTLLESMDKSAIQF